MRQHAAAGFDESLRVLIAADAKKNGASSDPRPDWKPRNSLSHELKKAVTTVLSGKRTNGLSHVEELIREPCVSNADSYLSMFKSNMMAFNAALGDGVDAIAGARTALEQSSESAPDKRTICAADRATLKKRERDVLEGLRKLKTDIAAATSKIETLSSSIHGELIDKSLKDHSSNRESGCPTKEKYLSQVNSELSHGLSDNADEPARSIFTYKLVYAKKRTSIGDARNILSHLLRTLDGALALQEAKIARIKVAFQSCRR